MRARTYLGHLELMVLLAILRVGEEAYGVTISRTLEGSTGRAVALASIYAALERLKAKRFVSSTLGEATPERGGRAKRYFRVTQKGVREARDAQRTLRSLWRHLPQPEGGRA